MVREKSGIKGQTNTITHKNVGVAGAAAGTVGTGGAAGGLVPGLGRLEGGREEGQEGGWGVGALPARSSKMLRRMPPDYLTPLEIWAACKYARLYKLHKRATCPPSVPLGDCLH